MSGQPRRSGSRLPSARVPPRCDRCTSSSRSSRAPRRRRPAPRRAGPRQHETSGACAEFCASTVASPRAEVRSTSTHPPTTSKGRVHRIRGASAGPSRCRRWRRSRVPVARRSARRGASTRFAYRVALGSTTATNYAERSPSHRRPTTSTSQRRRVLVVRGHVAPVQLSSPAPAQVLALRRHGTGSYAVTAKSVLDFALPEWRASSGGGRYPRAYQTLGQ